MLRNRLSDSIVRSASAMLFSLVLVGCVAAVPVIIKAIEGDDKSTATVTVNQDAATVYAEAVKSIKARGVSTITNEDPDNYLVEGVRKGKNATLKVEVVGPDKSRIVMTIEDDEDKTALNEVIAAAKELCVDLGLECQEEKA